MLFQNLMTDRLLLRPFSSADAGPVHALAGAREVAATALTIPHPYPDGAAETWIAPGERGRRGHPLHLGHHAAQ